MFSLNIYNTLCVSRKSNKSLYKPKSNLHAHHIIPKHSGGTDDESNITYLTIREHIIAHYLLWRIYRNPNDLRAMKMLGANLTYKQRSIIGKFCKDNQIGFFNPKYDDVKSAWRQKGLETQKRSGSKNTWYYWSTPEGRKHRASLGGKASVKVNKAFQYWCSPEGRKHRASLGGKAHTGKKHMHKPGDTKFKRVKLEDIQYHLDNGYILGSPHSPNKGRKIMHHPNTLKEVRVKIEDVQDHVNKGYIFGRPPSS